MRGVKMILLGFLLIGWAAAQDAPAPAPESAPAPAAEAPAGPPSLRQVQIQMSITEFTEKGLREIGGNLDYVRLIEGIDQGGSIERVTTNVFEPQAARFRVTVPRPNENPYPDNLRPDLDRNSEGTQTIGGAGLTFELVEDRSGTLEGILRGIETRADVDLLSKPELLVIDQAPAEIHAGQEVPYQSINYGNPRAPFLEVVWEKLGVDINLTPTIRDDNLIEIDLQNLTVSDTVGFINTRGVNLPVFSKREQSGIVQVPNNQTVAIGGLSSRTIRRSERRVPVAGKTPLLGIFFRGRQSQVNTNHLLIFIRPTIVDLRDLADDAVNALQFWYEGRWKNIRSIEDQVDLLANEP